MTNYVLSIDPGWSSGAALLRVPDSGPAELVEAWQFTGGVVALGSWISSIPPIWATYIAEKFTPRPNAKFGLTMRAVEPLRCEGILVDRGLLPDYENTVREWRDPKYQYVVGGKDVDDKKRRLHGFLKESGFYVTNKMFPDSLSQDGADDARSAIGHGLSYIVKELKHKPTLELLSGWSERNV